MSWTRSGVFALPAVVVLLALSVGHIIGTTMMGSDPKKSVVDRHCRAHDDPNLFVLGSSVFPTSSAANATSTIAALSLRAADSINKELGG